MDKPSFFVNKIRFKLWDTIFFLPKFLILINGAYRPKLHRITFLSQHKTMLVSFYVGAGGEDKAESLCKFYVQRGSPLYLIHHPVSKLGCV